MRYIRTQKELYKVMQKQICNTDKFVEVQRKKVGLFTGTTELISKDDIIGQADTIEELCDEYVLIHTEYDNSKDIFEAKSNGTWLQHRSDSYYSFGLEQVRSGKMDIEGQTIYGAIWTDKGLIYVAKLNDKGELELL